MVPSVQNLKYQFDFLSDANTTSQEAAIADRSNGIKNVFLPARSNRKYFSWTALSMQNRKSMTMPTTFITFTPYNMGRLIFPNLRSRSISLISNGMVMAYT